MLSREALTELLDALIWAGDRGKFIDVSYETRGFSSYDIDGNRIPDNELDFSFSGAFVKITTADIICRTARTDAELMVLVKDIYNDKI